MHSLLPDYLAKLRFDAPQLATPRALGEYRGKQQPSQWKKLGSRYHKLSGKPTLPSRIHQADLQQE